ncbi:BTB/POZ domain-containing protein [Aspergillus glaucus CBS 516.65]|uniref:BTB domain-containing protein n=1 Tax=Aspergillus glaucus CBS 516.65 TaxID=1160497 RepID=A0A1L9VIT7_ASPGL|nr:hypothetical protein ASPGLDRAFT_1491926 [Aspergillus glaucus CBS 516.65]OJJ83803.1 hypothetical protein ASPGLDRAFT_1491926 [Aspergillus glaucus CBS 516.65]
MSRKIANGSTHNETEDSIPGKELLDALASMRFDSRYSDLTILCGNESFAVHQCIVCTRSNFFSRACGGKFIEASTHTIKLDEEPALVKQMIEYFYTLDYQVRSFLAAPDRSVLNRNVPENEERTSSQYKREEPSDNADKFLGLSKLLGEQAPTFDPLCFHVLMYSLADRMFIRGLKVLSQENVKQELVQQLDAVSFPQAIFEIYNSTPPDDRGLRDLAIQYTMNNLTSLRSEEEGAPAAFGDNLLKSVPQFSYDLLVAVMNKSVHDWDHYGLCWRNWA